VSADSVASSPTAGVRAVALRDGGRVAFDLSGRRVTFAEVDSAADRLAQRLIDELDGLDAVDQPRVAVLAEEADAVLVAVEAIRRAAMVLVPIDPNAPPARVRRILQSAGAAALLTDGIGDVISAIPGLVLLHPLRDGVDAPPGGVERPPGRLGSIVFTSGSTGPPKGIMRAPATSELPVLRDEEGLRVGFVTAGSVAANLAALQLMAAAGWTSVCYQIRTETRPMAEWLRRSELEAMFMVPTVLRQVVASLDPGEKIPGIRFVGTFGESTTWEDVTALRAHLDESALVINLYAQSELGSIALMFIGADTPIGTGLLPVGHPLSGQTITVVDENRAPVPPGERGEIVVRGRNAALGYWGEDPKQSTVFFPQEDGTMIVHTGDVGRFLPDGTLEHLGRMDNMVKVAGANRVDLGEIEVALLQLDGVADATAAPFRTPQGETRLRAFIVPAAGCWPDPAELRRRLSEQLARYALPDSIELLDELPRLSNGKVDRRALPAPRRSPAPAPPGVQDLEERLAEIWRDVLLVDEIQSDADFFDLGGDSLRAAGLASEISRVLGIDVPLTLVMERPTLRAMAAALEDGATLGPVVILRATGAGLPVFAAHDHQGTIFPARAALAEHGRMDQPIYGFRALATEGRVIEATSLEELASTYASDVRTVVTEGPVVLFGNGTAATLAFEIACQLADTGTEVALLVLSTGEPPPEDPPPPRTIMSRLRGRSPRDLGGAAIRKAVRRASQARRHARPVSGADEPDSLHDYALHSYLPMWLTYRLTGRFSGRVLVIHSRFADPLRVAEWQRWASGAVTVVQDSDLAQLLEECHPRTLEEAARHLSSVRADP
jgi:acyl-coenzyme A synthetase/AMP-(fatty) acid ligase/thioesterase domain-containing protein/acyl carrier protein